MERGTLKHLMKKNKTIQKCHAEILQLKILLNEKNVLSVLIRNWQESSIVTYASCTYSLETHEFETVWAIEQNSVSESRDTQSPFPHAPDSIQAGYLKIYRYMREK